MKITGPIGRIKYVDRQSRQFTIACIYSVCHLTCEAVVCSFWRPFSNRSIFWVNSVRFFPSKLPYSFINSRKLFGVVQLKCFSFCWYLTLTCAVWINKNDDIREGVRGDCHPWCFAITHLIDTGVGVGDELTNRCPHIWLHRINMHRDLGNYYIGRHRFFLIALITLTNLIVFHLCHTIIVQFDHIYGCDWHTTYISTV